MAYRVTYAIAALDSHPVIKLFEEEWEALEWLGDEIECRINWEVSHSPYSMTEQDIAELYETESTLYRIERV